MWQTNAVAQIKFLAVESLHRVGGLVFVAHGNRFANELRKRDYVKGERGRTNIHSVLFPTQWFLMTSLDGASITLDAES